MENAKKAYNWEMELTQQMAPFGWVDGRGWCTVLEEDSKSILLILALYVLPFLSFKKKKL